ncbi:hypothetical protein [Shewanella livingstonensis]|uniref:hypothetical protein n=1 Tax=Shewanella livingstonensis TaxID=150120 RepID=UPI0039F083C5
MMPKPWYDLVNVAMDIDDEFDPNHIYAYQLASFAEVLNLLRAFNKQQVGSDQTFCLTI